MNNLKLPQLESFKVIPNITLFDLDVRKVPTEHRCPYPTCGNLLKFPLKSQYAVCYNPKKHPKTFRIHKDKLR